MTRVFCDRCQKETKTLCKVYFPCHLVEKKGPYVDKDMEPVTGRLVDKELCLKCYNVVIGAAFKAFEDVDVE